MFNRRVYRLLYKVSLRYSCRPLCRVSNFTEDFERFKFISELLNQVFHCSINKFGAKLITYCQSVRLRINKCKIRLHVHYIHVRQCYERKLNFRNFQSSEIGRRRKKRFQEKFNSYLFLNLQAKFKFSIEILLN